MPDPDLLQGLLAQSGMGDIAEKLGDQMYRIQWGSAALVTCTLGESIVVLAPMFDAPPRERERFFQRILEINAEMGGTAAFALQPDGAIVLQVGRGLAGLDAHEFGLMLGTVGRFADEYDDRLRAEFYA
jgi:hypothetical protein